MTDEFISSLPEFEAKQSKDFPEFLLVMCPREDCPGHLGERPFLVHRRTWMRPLKRRMTKRGVTEMFKIVGRSCPYCFRAARIPRMIKK